MNDLSKVQDSLAITKKNEVYAHIECERHLAKELSEYFTFFVPGYQFTPAFRNRVWDGKIRLFDLRSNNIYLGLLPYIEKFAEERGYEIEYGDPRPDLTDDFSLYLAKKFTDDLNLHAHGKAIQATDYQLDAFVHGMRHRRALLLSPTASGKSLIIYLFIRQFLDYKGYKGLIIVPTTSLVEQLYTDFADYSSQNNFDVESNVHRVYQGRDKYSEKNLIISTWQSLYQLPPEYFEQFDFIIGDEAHLFKAQSLATIMTSCTNTKYRIGLTGTLDGTKTHKLVLEGLFGPVERVTHTKDLIERGQLAEFDIKCLILKHPEDIAKQLKNKEYKDEIEYLIQCEARNRFIKNLALSLGNNTLILYQYVDKHGKVLYDWITNAKNIGNRKVFFIHGDTDVKDRENIRQIMEEEKDAIVVASFGTFSTGINIRNLHNIIFASPSKSRIRNLQSIGRGLRKGETKSAATLYDIADDLRVGKHMNFTLRHFVERTKIYTDEGFPYKLYKIGLKNGTN
jgi:superfamily II DNA or RNA helicase